MAFSKGLKRPAEEYNCLTPIIQDVNREVIAMKKESKAIAVRLMNNIVDYVVQKLKQADETFQSVYNDVRRVGSYFDGLRVTEPTEFDVNIVLQFPFHRLCKVEKSMPGYVRVCVKSLNEVKRDEGKKKPSKIRRIDSKLDRMVDVKGYICRDKVLQWWISIFAKAIQQPLTVIIDNQTYLLTWTTSGPAVTLHVLTMSTGVKTDIDLVPVLRFNDTNARSPTPVFQSHQDKNPALPKEWYIVPKPIHDDDTNRRWRLSFTDQEKCIMRGKEHLKPANRLLKRFRDKYGWKVLNSYMIKTIFLHETTHEPNFYRSNPGYLLICSLSTLKDYLDRKKLPFYWHHKRNMFVNIPKPTSANICGCVKRILAKIDSLLQCPSELEKYVRSLFI